jgi:restriction endonuclease S subunit
MLSCIKNLQNAKINHIDNICEIKRGSGLSIKNLINGPYPVIGCGENILGNHNNYNTLPNDIICSLVGSVGKLRKINYTTWASNNAIIRNNSNELLNDYLWHYLNLINDDILNLQKGICIKAISLADFKKLEVIIPPIQTQQLIVDYMDNYYDENNFDEAHFINFISIDKKNVFDENNFNQKFIFDPDNIFLVL